MSNQGEQRARGFAAGVFIGLAILMPVFAATSPGFEAWALPLMSVATILLLIGVGIAAAGLAEVDAAAARVPRPMPRRRAHAAHARHQLGAG